MDHKNEKAMPTVSYASESQRRRRTHSFSSTLLDTICQSMDEHGEEAQDGCVSVLKSHQHLKLKISKQQQRTKPSNIVALQAASFRQDTVNADKKPMNHRHATSSSSSSIISNFSYSDSSSMGPNSTSGSSYGPGLGYSSSSCFSTCSRKSSEVRMGSIKEKMARAKLRAISFCSELKMARINPVSPRRRLTNYLNSLFHARKHSNKASSANPAAAVPKQGALAAKSKKTASAANSSPSQLIKPHRPPPSTGIMSGSRTIYSDKSGREVFRRCQEKIVRGLKMREFIEEEGDDDDDDDEDEDEDEDEDDDAESYASSDLFELETLIVGGRGRGEELPVFETTDIKTNQVIANRLSM